MTAPIIQVENLSKTYRQQTVLSQVSFQLDEAGIYGLAGRNGAGKTTLLSSLLGQTIPTSGRVLLYGQEPKGKVLVRTHLQRTQQTYPEGLSVQGALKLAERTYPTWDAKLAETLLSDLQLAPKAKAQKLSQGQKSALGITLALASRADITLLDEPYTGLDPVARGVFYQHLLEDYAAHPRLILFSTHLLDEAAPLLSHLLVLDRGRLVLEAEADQVGSRFHRVTGSATAVSVYLTATQLESSLLQDQASGNLRGVTLQAPLKPAYQDLAQQVGVQLHSLSLQEVLAAYTTPSEAQGGAHD